jgi:hypothetical protein
MEKKLRPSPESTSKKIEGEMAAPPYVRAGAFRKGKTGSGVLLHSTARSLDGFAKERKVFRIPCFNF